MQEQLQTFNQKTQIQEDKHKQSFQIEQQQKIIFSSSPTIDKLAPILKKYINYQFKQQMDFSLIEEIVFCKKDLQQELLITDITKLLKYLQTFVIKRCCNSNNSLNSSINLNNLPYLKIIILFQNNFINQVNLIQLKSLEIVNLNHCFNITQIKIRQCPHIAKLQMQATFINQRTIYQIFNSLPELQYLNLSKCPFITQLKLKGLVQFKKSNLKKLNISQTLIKQLQLSQFDNFIQIKAGNCKCLTYLKISQCKNLKHINKILQSQLLEDVELIELPSLVKNVKIIDNKKLNKVSIKSCNSINKLLIYNSTLKDINLDNLPHLKSLNLSESKSLKEIKIQKCQNVESLILQLTPINDEQLKQLQNKFTNLKYLNLHSCRKIKNFNLNQMSKKIIKLNLCYTTSISDSDIIFSITSLKQLQYLNIMNCQKLKYISLYNLPNLRTLHLESIYVNYISLQNLSIKQLKLSNNCRNLQTARIQRCKQLRMFKIDCISVNTFVLETVPSLEKLIIDRYRIYNKNLNINLGNLQQSKLSCVKLDRSPVKNIIINCQFKSQLLKQLSIKQHKQIQKVIIQNGIANVQKLSVNKSWIQQIALTKNVDQKQTEIMKQENQIKQIYQIQSNYNNKTQKLQQQLQNCKEYSSKSKCLLKFDNLWKDKFLYDTRGDRITFRRLLINVYDHIFTNLKQLNLSQNSIKNIEAIQLIPNQFLQVLSLNDNQITIFKSLKKLKRTSLNLSIHQKQFLSPDNLFRFHNPEYKRGYSKQQGFIFGAKQISLCQDKSDSSRMKKTIMNYLIDGEYPSLCYLKEPMLNKMNIKTARQSQMYIWQYRDRFEQKSYIIL